jgi:hypothetical protein
MDQHLESDLSRSSNWVFRIRYSAALLPHYAPSKEYKRSTGKPDKCEARRVAAARLHALEEEWARLRRGTAPVDDLDPATVTHLYRTWYAERLKWDAERRISGTILDDPEHTEFDMFIDAVERRERRQPIYPGYAEFATDKLHEHGIVAVADSDAFNKAAQALADAWIAALQDVKERDKRWNRTTPEVPPPLTAAAATKSETLGELVREYAARRTLRPATVSCAQEWLGAGRSAEERACGD